MKKIAIFDQYLALSPNRLQNRPIAMVTMEGE